jgi:hypothetical protein
MNGDEKGRCGHGTFGVRNSAFDLRYFVASNDGRIFLRISNGECRMMNHPEQFTAELAKIAKAPPVSTTWAQRLGQNVPVCATFFLPPFLWMWGISLRAWRALRFKCTFWVEDEGVLGVLGVLAVDHFRIGAKSIE